MVRVCNICLRSWNNYSNRTFHQFPHNDEALKKKWIEALELDESKIIKYFYVCSDHFDKSCYTVCMKNRTLAKGSVPSKNIVVEDKSDQIQRPRFSNVFRSNLYEPFEWPNGSIEGMEKLPKNCTSLSEAAMLAKKRNLARKYKRQNQSVQKVICKSKPASSAINQEKTQNVLLYNLNHYTCIDYKQVKKLAHQSRSQVPIKAPARQSEELEDCTIEINSDNFKLTDEIFETSKKNNQEKNACGPVVENFDPIDESMDFVEIETSHNQCDEADMSDVQRKKEICESGEKKSKNLLIYRVNHYTCINYEQIQVVPPETVNNNELQLDQQKIIPTTSLSSPETEREKISLAKNLKESKTIINRTKRRKIREDGEVGFITDRNVKKKEKPGSSSKVNDEIPYYDPTYAVWLEEPERFTKGEEENDITKSLDDDDDDEPVGKRPYRNRPNRTQFVSNEGYNTFVKFAKLQSKTIRTIMKNLTQTFKRKQEKVKQLEALVDKLKNENKESVISDDYQKLPQLIKEILNRMKSLNSRENISPFLLDFAKTIYNSSPATYEILRNEFIYCLPHPNTISNHKVKGKKYAKEDVQLTEL